ncbi:MAG: flavodoxin family protein [Candidatus Aminicenantes bacterium]|nr:flavodoxin family protein [Candidatus Aminicenantes bacterium]
MAKILVTYFSLTGNTKKVAEAIFEALEKQKEILPLEEVKKVDEYDLLFIGFPVHSHSVPYKVESFLRQLPLGKKVALFSTHGSLTGSELSRQAIEHAVSIIPQAKVVGTFSCRGRISQAALEIFRGLPEHEAWVDMAASAFRHPDENDLEEARAFARWVMSIYPYR